jgi:hypothetical protein
MELGVNIDKTTLRYMHTSQNQNLSHSKTLSQRNKMKMFQNKGDL